MSDRNRKKGARSLGLRQLDDFVPAMSEAALAVASEQYERGCAQKQVREAARAFGILGRQVAHELTRVPAWDETPLDTKAFIQHAVMSGMELLVKLGGPTTSPYPNPTSGNNTLFGLRMKDTKPLSRCQSGVITLVISTEQGPEIECLWKVVRSHIRLISILGRIGKDQTLLGSSGEFKPLATVALATNRRRQSAVA